MENQIAEIIGYVGSSLGIISYLPQIIKIYKTKKADDISYLMFAILATSFFLWFIYGILMDSMPLLIGNAVLCTMALIAFIGKIKYTTQNTNQN